jgi:eukaryotic-like serine/threonine-protein kinase
VSPTSVTIDLPGRYRDARYLARGGMASVWAAEDSVLGRAVAIKVLADRFAEDPDAVRRFMREARAAARVSQHPHVVTIYDVVDEEGCGPLIVMELMDGGSLARVLRDGRPARDDALRWIAETGSALDTAHEHGIVHRDVKPANLLLDRRGRLAVADFGIARLAFESSVTQTGQILGTAAYVAPEQASGQGASAASDRYSLGVVAYELLTAARPYPGGPFAAQARQHLEAEPTPASAHAADLPPAVDRVLGRALSKDPGERWPSATAFAGALTDACGTEATQQRTIPTRPLRPAPPPPRSPPARAAAPPSRPGGDPPVAVARRRRGLLLPLALLAAILVGTLAALALSGGDDQAGDRRAADTSTGRGQPAREPRRTTETQPATPAQPESAGAAAESGESVASLNDRGFRLMNQGRYDEAIPLLQQAVQRCGDSRESVCAYALYNLGRSLRLAGRPAEAIPILERRLGYDNQTETVQAELDAARRAAGTATAPTGDEGGGQPVDEGGSGRGKKKGHGKKDD